MNPEDDPKGLLQAILSGYRRIRENPVGDIAMGLTPAGVVADVEDAGRAIRDRDLVGLGLAGIGFVPGVGDVAKGAGKAIRRAVSDLPMDEASRLARARELGFDVDRPFYHGNKDWRLVDESGAFEARGEPIYLTSKPDVAETYADQYSVDRSNVPGVRSFYANPGRTLSLSAGGRFWDKIPIEEVRKALSEDEIEGFDEFVRNLAESHYGKSPFIDTRALEVLAKSRGYDSFEVSDVVDVANRINFHDIPQYTSTVRAVFDPARIRSTEAAFDPAQRESANLLAGLAGLFGAGTAARMMNQNREER